MPYDFSTLKNNIKETEEWLSRELGGVRTGRASIALLDSVKAESYGSRMPLNQLALLSVEDARTLRIIPWDKTVMKSIEKAIAEADLGVAVSTDDMGLRVSFPELTADRRVMLGKLASDKTEHARVTLRGHRTSAIKDLEAAEKGGGMGEDEMKRFKDEIQKLIDAGNASLEALLKKKQNEISN